MHGQEAKGLPQDPTDHKLHVTVPRALVYICLGMDLMWEVDVGGGRAGPVMFVPESLNFRRFHWSRALETRARACGVRCSVRCDRYERV